MLYAWVKALVGVLLVANFAAPLYTVASDRQLWDEPMAVLAGNMSLICMLFGITHLLVGVYDITQLDIPGLCQTLQHSSGGFGIAFKMAQVCMAVDQFVAVAYPLQHYTLMTRARPWLFAATWLTWAVQPIFGIFAAAFDLETHADKVHGHGNGSAAYPECRWEKSLAHIQVMLLEAQMIFFSMVTVGLFVYTLVVGHITKTRLNRQMQELEERGIMPQENRKFFDNFSFFKKIIWVFSTSTVPAVAA